MSSLNPTEVSAIVALLDLRNSDHIIDLNVLSDLPSDSIDPLDNFDTQTMDTDFFFLNDNSKEKDHSLGKPTTKDITPEGGSLPLYCFAGAETNVFHGRLWILVNWIGILGRISRRISGGKVFRQVQMSTDGSLYGGDDDISRMDYAEASNSLWKDRTMNSMLDYDLEKAQSNTWIDEPLLDAILSEAHVVSSESGMDLLEWSIINDTLSGDKVSRSNGIFTGENANVSQQPKKLQNVCRKKSSKECKDQAPASQSRNHQSFASQQERLSASENSEAQSGTKVCWFSGMNGHKEMWRGIFEAGRSFKIIHVFVLSTYQQ